MLKKTATLVIVIILTLMSGTPAVTKEKAKKKEYPPKITGNMIENYFPDDGAVFSSGEIILEGAKNIKNGKWVFYYGTNDGHGKESEGSFVRDKKNGLWTEYKPDGKKKSEMTFGNDVFDGPAKIYNDDGTTDDVFYKNNVLHGLKKVLWPNGTVKEKGQLVNGKKEGPWTYYSENGIVAGEENYKEDRLAGTWKQYAEEGWLQKQGDFDKGKQVGMWFLYDRSRQVIMKAKHENDNLIWCWMYRNGVLTGEGEIDGAMEAPKISGKWIRYYPNGIKESECADDKGCYMMDKKNGRIREYYPTGKLAAEGEYTNNKRMDYWVFYKENGITMDQDKTGTYMSDKLNKALSENTLPFETLYPMAAGNYWVYKSKLEKIRSEVIGIVPDPSGINIYTVRTIRQALDKKNAGANRDYTVQYYREGNRFWRTGIEPGRKNIILKEPAVMGIGWTDSGDKCKIISNHAPAEISGKKYSNCIVVRRTTLADKKEVSNEEYYCPEVGYIGTQIKTIGSDKKEKKEWIIFLEDYKINK